MSANFKAYFPVICLFNLKIYPVVIQRIKPVHILIIRYFFRNIKKKLIKLKKKTYQVCETYNFVKKEDIVQKSITD